jgi:ATP synthase protein I
VVVLRIQFLFILATAIIFGYWLGVHGAISAILGGGVSFVSGMVFGLIISRHIGFLPDEVFKTDLKS